MTEEPEIGNKRLGVLIQHGGGDRNMLGVAGREAPGSGALEGPGLGLHLGQGFARKRLDSQGGVHRPSLSFYSGTGHLL